MKKILGWIFVALLIAGIASATVVKDSMVFEGVVTFINSVTNSGVVTNSVGTIETPVTLTETAGIGYVITGPSQGEVFYVAPNGLQGVGSFDSIAGVTVVLPASVAANKGWMPTIINTSGTSPMILYIDGAATIAKSGVTYHGTADAEGDSITLISSGGASGVSYYEQSEYIQ